MATKLRTDFTKDSEDNIRVEGRNSIDLVYELEVSNDYSDGFLDMYGLVKPENFIDEPYETHINIDLRNNKICDMECICDDFYDECLNGCGKACKHISATVYKYINCLEKNEIDYPDIEEMLEQVRFNSGDELLESLESSNFMNNELINIEVFLIEKNKNIFEATFKVGNKKLYILKNIYDFINAMDNGELLEFGKNFVYSPKVHKFSKEDINIINFIKEYASVSSALNENTNFGYHSWYHRTPSTKLVKNKSVMLVGTSLKRFLEVSSHKVITIESERFKGKANVILGDIPFSLSLKENDEEIILEKNGELPIALIDNSGVFLFRDNLYIPSEDKARKYIPFIKIFNNNETTIFKKEQAEKVFNTVIPTIKSITEELVVDKTIEDKIAIENLELGFYFDRNRNDVWCKIKTKYGNESFDILDGYKGDKYIVKDIKKESQAIDTLGSSKFYRNKDKFTFTGSEEELYRFLSNDMDKFKEIGEVYYSDKFKEQKVYKSQSISASVGEKGGFLEFKFNIDDVDSKEFNKIIKAFKENRKFYKLKNNSFVDLEDKKTLDFLELLDNIIGDKKIKDNYFDISKNRSIYLSDTIKDKNLEFIKGREIVDTISKSFETINDVDYKVPENLQAELRDYQVTGYKWFKTISHYGFGGILADEMGLGKTVQTIAFLLSEKDKKSLIVTPTSLIYNWKNEFEKFAPSIKICILHGSKEEREEIIKNISDYDVVLTTYGTLRNDFSKYEGLSFDYCIIDEGQNIKNPLSQSSEVVKEVKAKVKLALTGTPIENNLMELWSIFDFVMPGYLYNKTRFQEKFIGAKDEDIMKELKKLIRPFILRRLKSNVMKELPDKIEKKFFVEMTEGQKKVYSTFVKDIQEKMEHKDFIKDKITIFSYLTKLRQLCLDPSIIVEGYDGGSAKIKVALDIINENINNGNKILLFSQFTSVLGSLKEELDKNDIGYYYLDGSTKSSTRIDLVNSFNEDKEKKVFLISLKAGGTGLNLTSANVVVHFDPWWNPAIEDQATDRAHRIGQKNIVEVIKLISQGTVEEKIITMQEAKKELINSVMEGEFKEGSFLKNLNDNDIKELFK